MLTTIDIVFLCIIIGFPVFLITYIILLASSKRFRKWAEEYDKRSKEWQEQYKEREKQRKFEKRLRRINKEIEKTGTYTPSRSWEYYAKRNGFMPWND